MVSTPSRSRQATRISLPAIVGPSSACLPEAFLGASVVLLIFLMILAGPPQVNKKTHDRLPAVGDCRNPGYLRQAPTAASATTTSSSETCRITNIGGNLIKLPSPRQALNFIF